jgi:serine/threonine protein kinase
MDSVIKAIEPDSENGDQLREELQRAIKDNFTIEREIGRGGMATVYLASQHHPSRQVAIKVLDPDITTRLTRRRFLREVEVVSNLTHPHIVPIFSAGSDENLLYYVMPFIEGETLRHRIAREGPLPLEEALHIVHDVADALDHAHNQGVIHRDIKPENILLSGGHAVVADFGVARAMTCAECGDDIQPLTKAGLPIGTPMYMSPEQAAGVAEIDGRADLYSLACVAYEMLTGSPPYSGGTMYEIMNQHTTAPVPTLRTPTGSSPRFIRKAVARAMSKHPYDRFDTAGEFFHAISSRTSEISSVPQEITRKKLPAIAAVAAIVLATVAGLWTRFGTAGAQAPERVLVASFLNATGDASLDGLGRQAADWITTGLMEGGVVSVVSSGPSDPEEFGQNADSRMTTIAERSNAGTIVWGTYYLQAGVIQFQTQVTNAEDRTLITTVEPVFGSPENSIELLAALRENVVTAVESTFETPEGQ